jgi:hypothetical protein
VLPHPRFLLYAAAPPPYARTGFRGAWSGVLVFVALLVVGALLLISTGFLLSGQILLLTVSICLTPTVAYWSTKRIGRVGHVIFETILFMIILLAFGFWFFRTSVFGFWIGYVLILILLLEVGSNSIEWYKNATLKRLSGNISLRSDFKIVEKMFRSELIRYVSVPVGLIGGTIIALVRHEPPQATIVLCFQLVFDLASVTLLCLRRAKIYQCLC